MWYVKIYVFNVITPIVCSFQPCRLLSFFYILPFTGAGGTRCTLAFDLARCTQELADKCCINADFVSMYDYCKWQLQVSDFDVCGYDNMFYGCAHKSSRFHDVLACT